ncbi:MAG TPA: hypothetical protein VF006_16385 [Longimicrobium sp.]
MIRIRKVLALAALALALGTAADVQAQSSAQSDLSRWRGGRSEQLINQAVRHYGFRPNRLTERQVDAIQDTWYELFGGQSGRRTLSRAQATAIVYMALVHPYEDAGTYQDGRPGSGRPGGGWNDRPGGQDDAPPYRDDACVQMESDAYRLGNLISAPEASTGLFVVDPEKGRARTLARQIQQSAVECRASTVADRAAVILTALSEPLPRRSDLEPRVNALKQAIQQHAGRRR